MRKVKHEKSTHFAVGQLPFAKKLSKQNKVAARVLKESYRRGFAAAIADEKDLL